MDNNAWRARLAAEIKKQDRSLSDVSKKSGLSRGYLTQILKGEKEPGLYAFAALCEELGVSPTAILFGEAGDSPEAAHLFATFSMMDPRQRKVFLEFAQTFLSGPPRAKN